MPQNNQDIVNSQEFKDFCKNANLEVFNQEAINVLLFNQSIIIKDSFERIQKLEERLMETSRYVYPPLTEGTGYPTESLMINGNNEHTTYNTSCIYNNIK